MDLELDKCLVLCWGVCFLKVRVSLPIEEPMCLKVMKYVHKSQSTECQLLTFWSFWEIKVSRS